MANLTWQGGAASVAQVDKLVIGGTIVATDTFSFTIGRKVFTVVAGATVADTVSATIAAAWNALTSTLWPEYASLSAAALGSSSGAITWTADAPGVPFALTIATSGAATLTHTNVTASGGPNDWSTAANWSTGTVPATADNVTFQYTTTPVLYGLAQSGVTLASLTIQQSAQNPFAIGLPAFNGSANAGYPEYRPQFLNIGATAISIGQGAGNGSGRIKLDLVGDYAATIYNAGNPLEQGIPAILLRGGSTATNCQVIKGQVGIGFFAGDTWSLTTLTVNYASNLIGDAVVTLGSGATVTTVRQTGGQVFSSASVTTVEGDPKTQFTLIGSATCGTISTDGTFYDESTGTITTATIRGAYDGTELGTAKTITTLTLTNGAAFSDPLGLLTLTNGIKLDNCRIAEVTLSLPPGKTFSYG
jgi:hypothetical protein